jgi:3-hydroxyanthranilate 3,4-dioxygenase
MQIPSPIKLQEWINANRDLLKPPVGNRVLFPDTGDFIVMVVAGPNARKDFHVNQGEEIFYQLEGDIQLELMEISGSGKPERQILTLKEGEIFLLPAGVPHGPRRPEGSIGLVIERKRKSGELDAFQWYCENCQLLLHEEKIPVSDIEGQLKNLLTRFFEDKQLCTCRNCGAVMQKP